MILLSVVVPTYNRPQALQNCLASLAAQTFDRGAFEIVVCDDGSHPQYAAQVARACLGLRLVHSPQQGPAGARNTGAAAARGQFLVFLDDDCVANPDWLAELAGALDERALLAGKTLNGFADNLPSHVGELLLEVGLQTFCPGPGSLYFFRTTNLLISAAAFRAVGGFNTEFRTAEDREFCDRWQALGGGMVRVDSAVVSHQSYLTVSGFARRHFAYGRGAFLFHRQRLRREPFTTTFLAYYLKTLQAIWRSDPRKLQGTFLFALWQFANLTGFLWEMLRLRLLPHKSGRAHPRNAG